MKRRWSLVVPLFGLSLFSWVTYHSFRSAHEFHEQGPSRYFYWSVIRLDSDPLDRHPQLYSTTPCGNADDDCVGFDPLEIWINPGLPFRVLTMSAIPAFAIGAVIVGGLARAGVSEVATFLIAMPPLISAWFYLVGGLIDRRQFRLRSGRRAARN